MSGLSEHLEGVRRSLAEADLVSARQALNEAIEQAGEHSIADGTALGRLLHDLLEIVACFGETEEEQTRTEEITGYVDAALPTLDAALSGDEDASGTCRETLDLARSEWGEYLDLLPGRSEESDWSQDAWADDQASGQAAEEEQELDATGLDLSALLAGLADAPPAANAPASPPAQSSAATQMPQSPLADCPEIDAEILDAYADDATKCLASMEQCLLTIESDSSNAEAMQQFCRELHTLKGASGSVGLSKLAAYLHELEDYVESTHKAGGALDVDRVLKGVDTVREQLAAMGAVDAGSSEPVSAPTAPPPTAGGATPKASSPTPAPTAASDQAETSFVRVESTRLSKLLDLLAELVSLRNRRDTYVSGLRNLHSGVGGCVSRMRTLTEKLSDGAESAADGSEEFARSASRHATYRARELAELCSDVAELNRTLREVFDPLADDNLAVSRLIGEFRRELMDLQRVPVAGLFRRLHRGARDAARIEGKQIEIEFIGDQVRLDRSLQERMFEPLLHIVRNAVSHGIESASDREQAGKSPAGRITLSAHSNATSLVFEVRDDGAGLDYERVEQKGRERGLIPAGASPSRDRLARLIFHPGFSTRAEVSAVSGRGVGMDVVATQVHRMRGRVEISSEPGSGTAIQLQIPLRSAIEHAMVVRCGGQLFAVPMQFVQAARPEPNDLPEDIQVAPLDSVLKLSGRVAQPTEEKQLVVLGHQATGSVDTLAIEVDSVVGAEEVVVRAIPPLLVGHPLVSGLTLSGHGETVQILDVQRLISLARGEQGREPGHESADRVESSTGERGRVLVVDDSLSTRRTHVRLVRQAGFDTEEAADGLEALNMLKTGDFSAVLTDLEMPRLGGFELVSEIKQRSRIRDIPVIVITSRGDEETHRRLLAIGANQVVVKPLTNVIFADLHEMLREATTGELQTTC